MISPGEQCDGDDLQDFDCAALGYDGGTLVCDPVDCTFDMSMCEAPDPECGDGSLDPGEECDGFQFGGVDCEDFGFGGGFLFCLPACTIDTSFCMVGFCGDGNVDPGEQCDGDNLQGFDCEYFDLGGGTLACDPVTCTLDTSMCDEG